MSKTLALGVVLGATLSGSFGGTIGVAKSTLNSLNTTVKALDKEFKTLKRDQDAFNKGSLVGPVRQIANYEKLTGALKQAKAQSDLLKKSLQAHQEAKAYRSGVMADMRGTAMVGAAIATPVIGAVKVFMDQDSASTNAKMAYMSRDGVSPVFADITKKAIELGDALPGTTADFLGVSRVLKEQGLSDSIIKNGALESASKLNVLLGTSQEFGAEFVAKLVEARGLADSELGEAADIVQRARFAFGMKPEAMMGTMKYDAAMMSAYGIRGKENLTKNFALQGILATNGIEAEQAGNVLKNILLRTGKGVDGVMAASKGNKALARQQIEQSGVRFEFFDAKGNFKGLREMTEELQKLKIIKDKLGDKAAANVAAEIFGEDSVTAAMIIADKGTKGFDDAIQKMDEQASMQQRLEEQSKSLSVIWEGLTGTATNLAASFGSAFGPDLAAGFKTANSFISDTLKPWVENNKGLIKSVVTVAAGFIGMRLALGGVKLLFSSTIGEGLRWGKTLTEGYKTFKKFHEINKLLGKGSVLRSALQALKVPPWLIDFGGKMAKGIGRFGVAFAKDFAQKIKIGGQLLKGMGQGVVGVAKAFGQMGAMAGKALLGLGKVLVFKGGSALMSGLRMAGSAMGAVLRVGGALARVMGGQLFRGLMMAGRAVLFVGRALLMNPIGLLVTAIAVGGYLIYRNWDKLKPMFVSVFNTAKAKATSAWASIKGAWGGVKAWFGEKAEGIKSVFRNLPSAFAEFGRNIVQGLIDGVSARWGALKAKFSELAAMGSWIFKKENGINSPSRLFAAHGVSLLKGLGLGIDRSAPNVLKQMGAFAQAVGERFNPKVRVPPVALPAFKVSGASGVAARSGRVGPGAGASGAGMLVSTGGDVYHFHITQAEGESGESLARRVVQMIEQKAGARRRLLLGDLA